MFDVCDLQFIVTILLSTNLVHSYDTRQSNDLHIHYIKKSSGQRTVQHIGSILWSSVPSVLKKCMSKNHLKVK